MGSHLMTMAHDNATTTFHKLSHCSSYEDSGHSRKVAHTSREKNCSMLGATYQYKLNASITYQTVRLAGPLGLLIPSGYLNFVHSTIIYLRSCRFIRNINCVWMGWAAKV